jgi:gamma-glutamyl hercynylcysteine S-oxide synthase
MKRINWTCVFVLLILGKARAQQPEWQGALKELFRGPANRAQYDNWQKTMQAWRANERNKLRYQDSGYLRPELGWTDKSFIYAQVMAQDRYLFDPVRRKYTVDRYLNDLKKRYGGLDAVLIWPTYPNIGIDDRNQFDLLADMPGGLEGVKEMVTDFKKNGVRVFFPIMIWDKGSRDAGLSIPAAILQEMKAIGADGLNGDTMFGVTEDFLEAGDSLDYPMVFQPELAIDNLKMVEWNQMSWGYFWDYEYIPGVSVPKWLEPRHQVQVTNRWMTDKTNDLQYAFFNGIGYNAWENIWGIWNQVPERYAETIRRIAAIYRQFPGVWNSSGWRPHIPVLQKGVFASVFPGTDRRLYTFVNRDSVDRPGSQLQLPYEQGMKYFDLWNGKELIPRNAKERIPGSMEQPIPVHYKDSQARHGTDSISIAFPMDSQGFGALLVIKAYLLDSSLYRFLSEVHRWADKPLKMIPAVWDPLPQHIVPISSTRPKTKTPAGMVFVLGTDNYLFESKGVMIEGDELPTAVGVQHPWERHPSRSQKKSMKVSSFYIDRYPVTNRQFKAFVDAAHYKPQDDHHFLKDWTQGNYPPGWDDKPVTWVSLEDARAYARWAGKRLPHEWEWQYAGQGATGRPYPWGGKMDSLRIPGPDTSRNRRPPSATDAFSAGASPFGVMDMVGNVWQWTDEYTDAHTRSAIIKGGSYYRPQTSMWYFPQAIELSKYGKYLLLAPSIDRAGTIGFRCAVDTP